MRRAFRLAALAAALLTGGALAQDVRLRPATPEVEAAVRAALRAVQPEGVTLTLGTTSGPTIRIGGDVPFNPDVASRTITLNGNTEIQINPQGPLPVEEALKREVLRALGLSETATSADLRSRFGSSDLNNDGKTDLADFAILSANFGKTQRGLRGDLNRDGKVDVADLELFAKDYPLP